MEDEREVSGAGNNLRNPLHAAALVGQDGEEGADDGVGSGNLGGFWREKILENCCEVEDEEKE